MSSNRKDAIQRREMWALTSGEKARMAAAATVGGFKEGRGNSGSKQGAKIDRIWEDAARRVAREEAAVEREREKKAQAKADKKAARGWF